MVKKLLSLLLCIFTISNIWAMRDGENPKRKRIDLEEDFARAAHAIKKARNANGVLEQELKKLMSIEWRAQVKRLPNIIQYQITSRLPKNPALMRFLNEHLCAKIANYQMPQYFPLHHFQNDKLLTYNAESIGVYDVIKKQFVQRWPIDSPIHRALLNRSGTQVFVIYENGMGRLLDINTGNVIHELIVNNFRYYVSFTSDGNHIIATDSLRPPYVFKKWNVITGKEESPIFLQNDSGVLRFPYLNNDNKKIFFVYWRAVKIWDAHTETVKTISFDKRITRIDFSADGTKFLVMCDDTISVIDARTGNELFKLDSEMGIFHHVMFDKSGEHIAAVHSIPNEDITAEDTYIKVWDAATGQLINNLHHSVDDKKCDGLAYSNDGRKIVSFDSRFTNDGNIKIWNAQTGKLICTIDESNARALFTPDSQKVITFNQQTNTIKIWNATTGALLHVIKDCFLDRELSVSSDGTRLVSNRAIWDISQTDTFLNNLTMAQYELLELLTLAIKDTHNLRTLHKNNTMPPKQIRLERHSEHYQALLRMSEEIQQLLMPYINTDGASASWMNRFKQWMWPSR